MVLQFEGAVNNISEAQLAFIREVLEKRGYKDTKVTIEAVGKAGDNYLANVKRVIAKNEHGEFRMIAKIASQHEELRTSAALLQLFRNEHIFYTSVLPKYQQFEEQADLHKNDRLKFAECYGSLSEPPHEVILLEDMQVAGFNMMDRFTPLSHECIRSVLKNFAILHSLSFALKYKEPETFNEYKNNLVDTWTKMDQRPDLTAYFSHVENTAVMTVDGEDRKRYLKECVSQAIPLASKISKEDKGAKHSVIQQGDSWTNNILFKFNGDSLEQSVMIDYQLSRENNPTYDLMYMIFGCSDHETRVKYFNDWLDYYHSELDKRLHDFGLKANYVYPRDRLDADLKRYAKFMLGIIVMVATISVMNPANAAKMKDSMERFAEPIDDEANEALLKESMTFDDNFIQMFRKRVEGIVDSFMMFGLV
ncbi:hypothetical protein O3G_MSEX009917 [Manduca sexta]|uniref:CHK kinase-like domain-containing protein n=2 Tax=Manduca sexta TaxID=7130 RepID=A0A921ZFX4_MANSE|nr:hypothetical protein O3G_MSEX009917 [Manduca sexta]